MGSSLPSLVFTQGDPAGIGPELLLRLAHRRSPAYRPLFVAERAACEAVAATAGGLDGLRFVPISSVDELPPTLGSEDDTVLVLDPVDRPRSVSLGASGPADAAAALACLDLGASLVERGLADALITLPVSKASIALSERSDFRGHTDYLAQRAGRARYGRDYLMAFVAPRLKVALLTVHQPLRDALEAITTDSTLEALFCLHQHGAQRIALAGLNPHAGEGGLLGSEEQEVLLPAVDAARERGVDVVGPLPADSLFARAQAGGFDWVLALYHDQGLIAVKTVAPAAATNWTLGLPYLRTSVDHGTAFDIAGRGLADPTSLEAVVATTLELLAERRRET